MSSRYYDDPDMSHIINGIKPFILATVAAAVALGMLVLTAPLIGGPGEIIRLPFAAVLLAYIMYLPLALMYLVWGSIREIKMSIDARRV